MVRPEHGSIKMPFIPDQRTKDDLFAAPTVGHFVPDAGESYVPPAAEADAANAARQFDQMNRQPDSQSLLGQDQSRGGMGGLVEVPVTPPQGGQMVRKPMASPTDVSNESVFVPDHVPGYNPKDLAIVYPNGTKQKLPDWATPYAAKINDFGIGVADTLSSALSLPVDGAINMVKEITGNGDDIWKHPEIAKTAIKGWMSDHGLPNTTAQAFDNWWSDLGDSAATQGLLSLALIAGAGPLQAMGRSVELAGATAPGIGSAIRDIGSGMQKIGATAQRFPGQVIGADLAANVAGNAAPILADPLQKLGVDGIIADPGTLAVLGSLVGGLAGASALGVGRVRPVGDAKFGGMPRFGGKAARDAGLTGIPNKPIIPLTERTFNPAEISRAISSYQTSVTDWIGNRMAKITAGAKDPAVAADRMVQMMDQAWKKARVISDGLWKQVDQKGSFDSLPIKNAIKTLATSVVGAGPMARFLPLAEMREAMKWGPQITIKKARDMQSLLGSKIAEARKIPGTDRIVRNMLQMSDAIGNTLEAAFPADNNLKQAKEFTRWLHTKFDMGPTGGFGQVRADDASLLDSRTKMTGAMRHSEFGPGLADIGSTLGNDPAVQKRTGDYLRSQVNDIFQQAQNPLVEPSVSQAASAAKASQYMNSPDFKRLVRAFPVLGSVMGRQTAQLNNAIKKQLEINSSRFFRLAGEPEKAAENLVNSGTKLKDVALLTRTIGNDQPAMDALTFSVVRKLGQSVEWDPIALRNLVHSKDNLQMLAKLLPPGQAPRINNLLDAMVEFQTGSGGKRAGVVKTITKTSGKLIGLFVVKLMGSKSLNTRAIGSQLGATVLTDMFNILPPDVVLAKALTDPRWERFAMSKVPENLDDYRRTAKLLGALVGGINAGHTALMDQQDDGNAR